MKINTDGVLLGAWTTVEDCQSILDIGTGCGVIALMLAQRNGLAMIDGIEIDKASCEEAGENMLAGPWPERVHAIYGPVQEMVAKEKYDLIVSNPPFFSGGTLSYTSKKQMVRHTTKLSHQDLLSAVRDLLKPEGRFSVVLPYIEGLRFIEMAEQYRLHVSKYCEVHSFPDSKVERLLLTFAKIKTSLDKESISIRDDAGSFSEIYIQLTRSFYLAM
jgi:tRNA1Val (adenine37-N6)-methyltransferase